MEGEKFLGMPAKYKPFIIAGGVGIVGFLLLGRRGAGAAMPSPQFTPIGSAGPAPEWLDDTEQHVAHAAAEELNTRERFMLNRLMLDRQETDFAPDYHAQKGAQLEEKHWKQVDKFRPGSPTKVKTPFWKAAGDVVQTLFAGAVSAYAGGSPVTLGTSAEYAFLGGSKKKKAPKKGQVYDPNVRQTNVIWDDRDIDTGKFKPSFGARQAMVIWDDRDIDTRKRVL